MSEEKSSRISTVKKKLQSAGLTDQPSTQRVSSIVAKSKDPSSSTSSSLLRKKLSNTISNSGSNLSLKQTDEEIKKTRRKSFGENKEKESTTTTTTTTSSSSSPTITASSLTSSINTTSKLKPKSSISPTTAPSSNIGLKARSSIISNKQSSTLSSSSIKSSKSSSSSSSSEDKVKEKSSSKTTTLPPASSSLLSSIVYTKPLKDSDDNDNEDDDIDEEKEKKVEKKKETTSPEQTNNTTTTTTTTTTTSTPSTPSAKQVVNRLKRKSIESGNIFQFDQAKEDAVLEILNADTTNTNTNTESLEKESTNKKKTNKDIEEENEQDLLKGSNSAAGKKKTSKLSNTTSDSTEGEEKKKKKVKKVKTTIEEEDDDKKKKKKKRSSIISTITKSAEDDQDEKPFNGLESILTTSSVGVKKSKAYPKTPLPNKVKSFDEIMDEVDNGSNNNNYNNNNNDQIIPTFPPLQQQLPQQQQQQQNYQIPFQSATPTSKFLSSINSKSYFTPRSQPVTPNTTNYSIHNYPESPSPGNIVSGFQYSTSPISIPKISADISFTNSERDISFQTDENFLNEDLPQQQDQQQQQQRQQQKEIKKQIISNSKLGNSKLRYVLLGVSFLTWFYLLFLLFSFFYHFNDPIFCDTGVLPKKIGDRFSCIPCPDKGICINGLFDSCIDGYVPNGDECILNPNKVESLVSTINQIDLILRDRKGLYECGSRDTFYMTSEELMKEIAKRNWFSKNKALESFQTILDFIDNRKDSEDIGLDHKLLSPIGVRFEDEQFKYYSNNQSIRPLWCQTVFFFKNLIKSNLHWIVIVLLGIGSIKFVQIQKKKKEEELLSIDYYTKKAIRVLQERKEYEESWISDLVLKDEVIGNANSEDKKLNKIWDSVLSKLSSNVRVLDTVRLVHGESRTTLEWIDSNKTPRKSSIPSEIPSTPYDHDEISRDFGNDQDQFDNQYN